MKEKKRYLCIKIDESLHKKLRMHIAENGSTIQEILEDLIKNFVDAGNKT